LHNAFPACLPITGLTGAIPDLERIVLQKFRVKSNEHGRLAAIVLDLSQNEAWDKQKNNKGETPCNEAKSLS